MCLSQLKNTTIAKKKTTHPYRYDFLKCMSFVVYCIVFVNMHFYFPPFLETIDA